jgi:uncharacterized Zn-binding protein involved in type VI secretion
LSLNYIAVDGCTLQFQGGGTGDINITPGQTSTKVKADGKAVYLTLKFTIANYTGQAITVAKSGTGQGEIIASSTHVKVEGNKVFLEGDMSAQITINGLQPSGSGTAPAVAQEFVKILKAGQTKVRGA